MSILAVQPPPAAAAPDPAATGPLAEVVGGDLTVPLVHGGTTRYVNLDYAASGSAGPTGRTRPPGTRQAPRT
jgi:hypothetical protein